MNYYSTYLTILYTHTYMHAYIQIQTSRTLIGPEACKTQTQVTVNLGVIFESKLCPT